MEPRDRPAYFLFPSPKSIMATDTATPVKKGTTVGRPSPEEWEVQESRYHGESVSQKITGGESLREKAEGGRRNNLIRSMILQIKWPRPVLRFKDNNQTLKCQVKHAGRIQGRSALVS